MASEMSRKPEQQFSRKLMNERWDLTNDRLSDFVKSQRHLEEAAKKQASDEKATRTFLQKIIGSGRRW